MKLKAFVTAACSVALSAALLCGLSACGSTDSIAATVGSKTIKEETITKYIESYRASYGLDDDSTFASMLSMYGMTPETFREYIVDMYVDRELVMLAAEEKGMSIDSATIDSYVEQMKANYGDDSAWQTALENAGMTEQEYRDRIEYSLLYQELSDSFGVAEEPTDEQVLTVAKENLKYFSTAKRSSHILFSTDDKDTAQEVLDKLNAGTITWDDAVSQYSTDTSSAEEGGNVGWDLLTSFVSEYQTALDGLELNQMSELVESSYGYHIIKCTEVMPSEDKVKSLSDLPEEFQEFFKELATTTSSDSTSTTSTTFSKWLNGYKTTVEVKINDMPKGLSYDVDMTATTTSSTDSTSTSTDSTSTSSNSTSTSTSSTDTSSSSTSSTSTSDVSSTSSTSTESSSSSDSSTSSSAQ